MKHSAITWQVMDAETVTDIIPLWLQKKCARRLLNRRAGLGFCCANGERLGVEANSI